MYHYEGANTLFQIGYSGVLDSESWVLASLSLYLLWCTSLVSDTFGRYTSVEPARGVYGTLILVYHLIRQCSDNDCLR